MTNIRKSIMTLLLAHSAILSSLSVAQETEQQRIDRVLSTYEKTTVEIPNVSGRIDIDGDLSDPLWSEASVLEIAWQRSPIGGLPAKVKTLVYIMEDGEKLYVGFKADDPNPEEIHAYLGDRDKLFRDDYVGFGIDTTGDSNRAFEFFSNPLGVQGDAIVDVESGEDMSFDAIFDTAGQITAQGFEVEFAIPLNQLRFPKLDGKQHWKMFFTRTYPRDNRYQAFQYPVDKSNSCFMCQYQSFTGLEGAEPGKKFQIIPTLTSNRVETIDPATGSKNTGAETQLGIDDFRWGITPDLTLNAMVNPDFSQVESDIAQLSVNSNFSLFNPEKRAFFMEGADFFNTQTNLVHTRNIADPDYGIKLTGKIDSNVYGLFTAKDSVTNIVLPGNQGSSIARLDQDYQATVLRYRRDLEGSSSIGVLLTDRAGDDYSNQVISVDGRYRISSQDTFEAQLMQSDTHTPSAITTLYSGVAPNAKDDAYRVEFRHNAANSDWWIEHESRGKDFRADAGFVTQADISKTSGEYNYSWPGQSDSFISRTNTGYYVDYSKTNESNEFLARSQGAYFNITIPHQTFIGVNRTFTDQVYNGQQFNTVVNVFNFRSRPINGLNYYSQIRWGDQIDFAHTRLGDQLQVSQTVDYNLNRHLLMQLKYTYRKLEIDNDELFTATLSDLRLTYQFNVRSYLRFTAIHSDLSRNQGLYTNAVNKQNEDLDFQLLYSYKLNPQSVFFAGYSTSSIDNDNYTGFQETGNSFFIKISYAWVK